MKFAFMKKHAHEFSVEKMSKIFKVSRNGYYRSIKSEPSTRALRNRTLLVKIKQIHTQSRETYGSPRIHAALKLEGEKCSKKRVAYLMKKEGLQAKMKKRFKKTTNVNPKAEAAPNLLKQDFTADKPNQRWVADITYVATAEGWLYVAAVLDLFSRKIVGLSMSERMTTNLVVSALEQAITHRKPQFDLIHHSDKGSQYTSQEFQRLLKTHKITVSMSGTGNCFDNAAMESFFHTLKTEHVYFEHYRTREQAKLSIFEYIEVFYNRQRLHSTLGYLTPVAFENKGLGPLNPGIFKDTMQAFGSAMQ
jgi:transposase InsO family protein